MAEDGIGKLEFLAEVISQRQVTAAEAEIARLVFQIGADVNPSRGFLFRLGHTSLTECLLVRCGAEKFGARAARATSAAFDHEWPIVRKDLEMLEIPSKVIDKLASFALVRGTHTL